MMDRIDTVLDKYHTVSEICRRKFDNINFFTGFFIVGNSFDIFAVTTIKNSAHQQRFVHAL